MSGKNKLLITAFILVGLVFAVGLFQLFAIRFEKGDMFPPYSSLRSDPLGCKALFMALERISGLEAVRNFRDPVKLKGAQGRTIFYLGAGEALLAATADSQAKELEALAREGNRLVIAFLPAKERAGAAQQEEKSDNATDQAEDEDQDQPSGEKADTAQSCTSRTGTWGIGVSSFDPPVRQDKGRPQAVRVAPNPDLPPSIPLHSRRWLQPDDKDWRPVYSFGEHPVVLERRVGRGSIVLLADTYLLSNEAMRNDRQAGLLAWLQGTHRVALFDESHLGVIDNPGIMGLIRKHRLIPFLIALIALAALYIWKNAVPFVNAPFPENELRKEGQRDNFSGLVNLLRRNIPPSDLLNACFREWSKSFAREFRQLPALEEQVKAIVVDEAARPSGKRDPLARFREIQSRLRAEGRRFKV